MAKRDENTGFVCVICQAHVEPVTNGSYRNHCPFCLWSLHVDGDQPGDRLSICCAPMKPIQILMNKKKKKKGLQVLHRCTSCGKVQPNKIALDTVQDDFEAILEFIKRTEPMK